MNMKMKTEVSILQVIGSALVYIAFGYFLSFIYGLTAYTLTLKNSITNWDGVLGFVFLFGVALVLLGLRFTKKFKPARLGFWALLLVCGYAGVLLGGSAHHQLSGWIQLEGAMVLTIIIAVTFGLQIYRSRRLQEP